MAVEAEDMAARLLTDFRHALENGQLVAYFQPELELSSGRVVAAECLARWEHPDLGTLLLSLFAPLAEQLGLMGELTRRSGRHPVDPCADDPVRGGLGAAPRQAGGRAGPPSVGRPPVAAQHAALPGGGGQLPAAHGVGLHRRTFNPLGGILLGALVLTLLVTVRQFAALRDNGLLAARYQELASIDEMTGLYKRRHFMELAEGAFAHTLRVGEPQVRADDIAGRYGGDEFIIIPGTTSVRPAEVAAQLTGAKRAGGGCWRAFEGTGQVADAVPAT
jgi:EAL domain